MANRFRFFPRLGAVMLACACALVASGCGGNPQIAMRTALDGSPETGVALVGTTDIKNFKAHPTTTPVDLPNPNAVASSAQPGVQAYNGAPAMTMGSMPTIRLENAPVSSSTITALSSLEPPTSSIYGAAGPPVLPPSPEPSSVGAGAPIPSVKMPAAVLTSTPPMPPRVEEPGTNLPGVEPLPDVIEPPPRRVEMPRKGDTLVPAGSVTIMMPSDVAAPAPSVGDEPSAVSSVNRAVELPDNPAADTGMPISVQRTGPNPAIAPVASDLPASIKAAGVIVSPFVNPAERFSNTPTTGSESDRATGIDVGVPDELPKVLPRAKTPLPSAEPASAPAPSSLVPDPAVVMPPIKLGKNGKPIVPKVKEAPDRLSLPGATPAPVVTGAPISPIPPIESPATITPTKEIAKTADAATTVAKETAVKSVDEAKTKVDSAKHDSLPAATAVVTEAVKPVVDQATANKPAPAIVVDEAPPVTKSAWGLAPSGPTSEVPAVPSKPAITETPAPAPESTVSVQAPGPSPKAEPEAAPAPIAMSRADEPAAPEIVSMTRDDAPASAPGPKTEPIAPTPATEPIPVVPRSQEVVVITTKLGRIVIALDEEAAPLTTANFKKLVQEKFYDGTTFHRTVNGMLIQGGDPNSHGEDRTTHGKGGPGYTILPEIKLDHKRGSVAAARGKDANNPGKVSNGSQFYICVTDFPSADGKDTVFGHVVEGMDVVQKISNVPKDAKDNPIERVEMTGAIETRDTGPSPRS